MTEILESKKVEFLRNKDLQMDSSDISICHPLTYEHRSNMKPRMTMNFKSRNVKLKSLIDAKKLKVSGVNINDYLTKHNADLARKATEYKIKEHISTTWKKLQCHH